MTDIGNACTHHRHPSGYVEVSAYLEELKAGSIEGRWAARKNNWSEWHDGNKLSFQPDYI